LALGGFEEGYINGFEDLDFCLRAGQAGYRVCYIPESVLIHFECTSKGRKQHDKANFTRFNERCNSYVRFDDEDIYRSEGITLVREPDGRILIEREQHP
jgi:GT2 family glycosyltransferase